MHDSHDIFDPRLVLAVNDDLQVFAADWQRDPMIISKEPIQAFCDVLLRGGKRMRGLLVMESYFAHGGKDEVVALGAARVFEIIQTSLLIVDDIADRSRLRRGGPSAHVQLGDDAKRRNLKGDPRHYGEMQTMNAAYAGLHKATTELLALPVGSEVAREACRQLHENILVTIYGQIDDIYNEAAQEAVTETIIESIMQRKTAHYSFLGPIDLGARLAGASKLSDGLRDYSIHAGCAFQVADDIIGTFGKENETGKGTNDDIIEGKLTLLAFYAQQHGTAEQKAFLSQVLGNENATSEQCDEVRRIFKASGALGYAKERLGAYETQALRSLESDAAIPPAFADYLRALGDYLLRRKA